MSLPRRTPGAHKPADPPKPTPAAKQPVRSDAGRMVRQGDRMRTSEQRWADRGAWTAGEILLAALAVATVLVAGLMCGANRKTQHGGPPPLIVRSQSLLRAGNAGRSPGVSAAPRTPRTAAGSSYAVGRWDTARRRAPSPVLVFQVPAPDFADRSGDQPQPT